MPSFGFDKVSGMARNVRALLNPEGGADPDAGQHEDHQTENPEGARRRRIAEQREMLRSKRQELREV